MRNQNYNIKLKNNWDDITISDYFTLKSVTNMVDILSVLTSLDKEILNDYPLQVLNELVSETDFIHGEVPINEDIATDMIKGTVKDGQEYIYRLNLNVGEWEAGRFMEFMEFSSDAETINDHLHLLMVIACDKYKIEEGRWWIPWEKERMIKIPRSERNLIEEGEWGLYNFPISTTLSVLTFFLTILESFSNDTVDSLDFAKIVMESMVEMDTIILKWSLENPHSIQTLNGSSTSNESENSKE